MASVAPRETNYDGYGFEPSDRPEVAGSFTSGHVGQLLLPVCGFCGTESLIHYVGETGWAMCGQFITWKLVGLDGAMWGHPDFLWCPECDELRGKQDRAAKSA